MNPLAFLLPLGAAFLYTFATVFSKRAIEEGAGIMRMAFISNMATFLFPALALAALHPPAPAAASLLPALVCGALFFAGQVFIFCGIRVGDVTIQVPLLGIKVVFVAICAVFITGTPPSWRLFAASAITMFAVFLMGISNVRFTRQTLLTIVFVVLANLCFAFSDCVIQVAMSDAGPLWFVSAMYFSTFLCSFGLMPFFKAPLKSIPKSAWKWALPGGVVMAVQGFLLVAAIGGFKIATEANIIYASRGLWSIVIIWFAGKSLGIHEKNIGKSMMLRRLAGASLLMLAVVTAIA